MSTVPTLRSVAQIPASAWAGIADDVQLQCRCAPGLETAGVLLMSAKGDGMASGPGLEARRTPTRCDWDPQHIAYIVEFVRQTGGTVLGRWHKHTSPIILASDTDRESADVFREALALPVMLDLIVACGADDRPIAWAAYLCSDAGYERVDLELPGGSG